MATRNPKPASFLGKIIAQLLGWLVCIVVPGFVTVITPAQLHMSVHVTSTAGMLAMSTVAAPGVHGAAITGMQGIGVNTPSAAAVAEATVGLARLWHMPNGRMFAIGLLSMMLAAGLFSINTLFCGRTMRLLGAIPKLQVSVAPMATAGGMRRV